MLDLFIHYTIMFIFYCLYYLLLNKLGNIGEHYKPKKQEIKWKESYFLFLK